jgi:hypothetical protein
MKTCREILIVFILCCFEISLLIYTGHFIIYSGITTISDRKTVGQMFTKPVQLEGGKNYPESCFSSWFTFLLLGDASVCGEKMAALGEKPYCVLEYRMNKSVVSVQRAFRAKYAKDPPTDKTGYSSYHCHVISLT